MLIRPLILLMIMLLSSFSVLGQSCKFNYAADVKKCPDSGTTLLDDTYPVSTFVISLSPHYANPKSQSVPGEFIIKVLESYKFSESSPNIVVPSNPEDFQQLKKELEGKIASSKGKIPASILKKVIPAESQSYTWQQDYFESFINPTSGRPVVRKIGSYDRGGEDAAKKLVKSISSCEITEGEVLKTDHQLLVPEGKSFASGEMGGNIEGLPGGFCLVGDNQSSQFASQFCGKDENTVQMDVSWLSVGHVDEVFKVIPTNLPGVPKECNFSLMFASPRKAMELLSEPRSANHPLFSGSFLKADASTADLKEFRLSRSLRGVGNQFCHILDNFAAPSRGGKSKGDVKGKNGASQAFYFIKDQILSDAHASEEELKTCEIESITNAEFLKAMKEPEFLDYNELVQKSIDESKKKITQKILSRLPQCGKHLSLIDVPDLFYGTPAVDENGHKQLARPGDGGSFMPNPTNSVVANGNIIFSDPQNPLFRDYLTKELKQKKVQASFIDTWDYAHLGNGNLHCSSHSLPYCSPVKKAAK